MPMHLTAFESLRGNARTLGTFACSLPAMAGGIQVGNKRRGPACVGDGMA